MLHLATDGHDAFHVSTIEVDRGGVSYTVETLGDIHDAHPNAELYFLMGADSLEEFSTWKSPAKICELAIPLIVARPGSPIPNYALLSRFVDADRLKEIKAAQVDMPQLDISSTDLRHRASKDRSIRFQTPRAVEKYIETQKLYAA